MMENRRHYRIAAWLNAMMGTAFVLLLASCTLFLEDYYKTDVPKHTGEGYDAPVTEVTDDYSLTYQFNSNVRQLTDEAQRYITNVESLDENNMARIVTFSKNTPDALLPRVGEIITSTITEAFPYGIAANVVRIEETDNSYQLYTSFATTKEVFKELELDGVLSAEAGMEVEEEPEDPNAAKPLLSRAGSDDVEEESKYFIWDDKEKQLSFTIPGLPISTGSDKLGLDDEDWTLTMPSSKNTIVYTFKLLVHLNAEDDIQDIRVSATKENNFNVNFKGKINRDITLLETKKFKFALPIGPVVISTYIKGIVSLEASLEGELDYTHNTASKATIMFSTDPIAISVPELGRVTKDEQKLTATFSGTLEDHFKLQLGAGLYDIVHLREELDYVCGQKSDVSFNMESGSVDITNSPTLDIYQRVDASAQVFVVSGLPGIIKTALATSSMAEWMLYPIPKLASKFLDFKTPIDRLQEYANEYFKDSEEEVAISKPLKTSVSIAKTSIPWFPKMEDNSWKLIPTRAVKMDAITFNAEYAVEGKSLVATFKNLYPSLQVRDGNKVVTTINSMESFDSKADGKVYHFSIENLDLGKRYTAVPCYRLTAAGDPMIFDRGVPFNTTMPNIFISSATIGNWVAGLINESYEGRFATLELEALVDGKDFIEEWGIRDMTSGQDVYVQTNLDKQYSQLQQPSKPVGVAGTWKWQIGTTEKSVNVSYRPFAILKESQERLDFGTFQRTYKVQW